MNTKPTKNPKMILAEADLDEEIETEAEPKADANVKADILAVVDENEEDNFDYNEVVAKPAKQPKLMTDEDMMKVDEAIDDDFDYNTIVQK